MSRDSDDVHAVNMTGIVFAVAMAGAAAQADTFAAVALQWVTPSWLLVGGDRGIAALAV